MLVELGPQQYTQPLGNQGDGGNSKRDAAGGLADTLYAQRQEEKRRKQEEEEEERRRQAEKQVGVRGLKTEELVILNCWHFLRMVLIL